MAVLHNKEKYVLFFTVGVNVVALLIVAVLLNRFTTNSLPFLVMLTIIMAIVTVIKV